MSAELLQTALKRGDLEMARAAAFGMAWQIGRQSTPEPDSHEDLPTASGRLNTALQAGDLDTANSILSGLVVQLTAKLEQQTPRQKLAMLEKAAPGSGLERFYALSGLARAAFDAGEMDKAEGYASELLSTAPSYPKDWNYGNAVFHGNTILGLVAIHRDKNLGLAKRLLLASGQTTGSPQLDSFGPNLSLAQDLLNVGERDTVLEFLNSCRRFWKMDYGKLDEWAGTIKRGAVPDFGANLLYH